LSSSSGNEWPPRDPAYSPDRRIDERAIDRRLLALLIARHGEPPRARRLTPEEEERRLIAERRDRALAAASPALIRHIERHDRSSERPTRSQEAAARAHAGTLPSRPPIGVDWASIQLREIGEVRELELSDELRDALEHRTPQAFLRDLHRPVQYFGDVQLRSKPLPTAGAALERVRAQVREAMARPAGEVGRVERASQLAKDGYQELREIMARPWEDSKPENPLPMATLTPGAADWQWFGMSGGYDPDL
jgi:hypothetical protein